MKKEKSLWRKNKYGEWYKIKPINDKVIFIPCDEFTQTYQWHKTNKGDKINRKK